VILLLAMVAKDASHINDPYVMRGIAQGLCFIVGVAWMLVHVNITLLKRYWPIFGYLCVSLISGLFSPRMEFALIQTTSLVAVLFFSIAYFESQSKKSIDSSDLYFSTTIIVYAIVCFVSILLIKLAPSVVYGRVGEWDNMRAGVRFRGLFSASGMMGAASGLLIGYVLFIEGKWWWRGPVLAMGLICLALTQSRTFWVAAFITSMFVWWFYKPHIRQLLIAVAIGAVLLAGSLVIFNVSVDSSSVEKEVRVGSIATLSGRLPLWEMGAEAFYKRPFIGYGSTMGSYALRNHTSSNLSDKDKNRSARSLGTETLHNGYLQTILDLGVLGFFFYVAIFVTAIKRVYRRDTSKKYGAVIYGVMFMAIGNLGESIVYSASVSHSIVFWIVAVFALHRFVPGAIDDRIENNTSTSHEQAENFKESSILRVRKRDVL